MPQPRKSTKILKQSGAFAHNPSRAVGRGNDANPTGDLEGKPTYLNPTEILCWDKIVSTATPGVLKRSDWITVLATTRLFARLEEGTITAAEHGQLKGYLQELAMTPKARPNVQIPVDKAINQFNNL